MEKKSTKRSKNFTNSEITALVAEIEKRRTTLFGPLKGSCLTQNHKDRAWEKVLEAVNAVSPTKRTVEDLKKKFRDLKSRTKQKANLMKREARKTGGGQNDAAPLNAEEEKVISFIGNDSIEGITGGIDTFRKNIFNMPEPSPESPSTSKAEPASPPPSPIISSRLLSPPSPSPDIKYPSLAVTTVPPLGFSDSVKTKRKRKSVVQEIRQTIELQAHQNQMFQELLIEFRDFKQQFLELKKKEIEIMQAHVESKKRRTN